MSQTPCRRYAVDCCWYLAKPACKETLTEQHLAAAQRTQKLQTYHGPLRGRVTKKDGFWVFHFFLFSYVTCDTCACSVPGEYSLLTRSHGHPLGPGAWHLAQNLWFLEGTKNSIWFVYHDLPHSRTWTVLRSCLAERKAMKSRFALVMPRPRHDIWGRQKCREEEQVGPRA